MRRSSLLLLPLAVAVAGAAAGDRAGSTGESRLFAALRAARQIDAPVEPLAEARRPAVRHLFEDSLTAADPGALAGRWHDLGFELIRGGADRWWIAEREGSRRGRGVYAFHATTPGPLVTAPHGVPNDDMLTAEIVVGLFEAAGVRAAGWSTVRREEIDLAHADDTVFHQFVLAFAATAPRSSVVEVHGFAQDKRRTVAGRRADAILSNGTRRPDSELRAAAGCLADGLGVRAGIYPEIAELGGTTNSQGKALRQRGSDRFVHLELSRPLRQRLAAEQADLDHLARCVVGGEG